MQGLRRYARAPIASACGGKVVALEEDEALMAIALRILPNVAPDVRLVQGKLALGLPNDGTWDAIIIEGAVAAIPDVYAQQLAPLGRLVTVVAAPGGRTGRAVLAEPVATAGATRLRARDMFDCNTPLLPGLRPAPEFVF